MMLIVESYLFKSEMNLLTVRLMVEAVLQQEKKYQGHIH